MLEGFVDDNGFFGRWDEGGFVFDEDRFFEEKSFVLEGGVVEECGEECLARVLEGSL